MTARSFMRDTRGVFAIEFAILAPVLLIAGAQSTVLWQSATLTNSVQFSVMAAATAGAAVLHGGGADADAEAKANAIIAANAATLPFGATFGTPTVSINAGVITVTVQASAPALFSMFQNTIGTSGSSSA